MVFPLSGLLCTFTRSPKQSSNWGKPNFLEKLEFWMPLMLGLHTQLPPRGEQASAGSSRLAATASFKKQLLAWCHGHECRRWLRHHENAGFPALLGRRVNISTKPPSTGWVYIKGGAHYNFLTACLPRNTAGAKPSTQSAGPRVQQHLDSYTGPTVAGIARVPDYVSSHCRVPTLSNSQTVAVGRQHRGGSLKSADH